MSTKLLEAFNSERIYWAVEQVEQQAGDIDNLHLDDNLFYIKSEADKALTELNDKLRHLPMMATLLDSDKEEIAKLKRALWIMTAEWSEAMGLASCNIANKFMSRENFEVSDDYRNNTVKKHRHRQVVFYKYAEYCRKKAEAKQ